jgi:hypothetical protein
MGYHFVSRNKKLPELDNLDGGMGFSWPWFLKQGAGLPIGITSSFWGFENGDYLLANYRWKDKGLPIYNDGAYINAREAKAVADCIDSIIMKYEEIEKAWRKLARENPEEYHRRWGSDDRILEQMELSKQYEKPVRPDFLEKGRRLAEWMRKSCGFYVH